jgi:hypothetical protein
MNSKRRRAPRRSTPHWCAYCSKLIRPSREEAVRQVESVKSRPGVRKPELLDAYYCPQGRGWHIGHNYKRKWISLCVGEHK